MTKKPQTVGQYIAARSAPVYGEAEGHPLVYLYGGKDHANLGFLRRARAAPLQHADTIAGSLRIIGWPSE